MAFGSRLLILAIVPLVTLLAFRSYIPDYDLCSSLSNKVLNNLPPRWETPIIVSAFTHWSHYEKVAKVALVLAELGYPITFVTGRVFEEDATKLHPLITFQPLLGGDDKMSQEDYETYESKTPGLERELFIMKVALMGSMKPTHDTLQQVFRDFREKHGDTKPLISLFDTPVIGHHPILLGAPGIKPDSSIVINCHPLVMDSNDTFPPFAGKIPHTGPDAKVIHQQANLEWRDDYQTITLSKWYWEALENFGAQTDRLLMDSMHTLPDQILSLGVPEFEFPRSDLRKNVHYFGYSYMVEGHTASEASRQEDRRGQSRHGRDGPKQSVLPTLEALKDRDDVLVVATTVAVEPAEVPDLVVSYNARVAKFVPYDLLLPMVDVLVNNGGYGAIIQALEQGIPLVVAGEGQDKAITNAIIQWSGVGVHVGGRSPGPGKIREGLQKVLDDERYTQKAKAMSKNFDRYDVETVADSVIQDVVRKWAAKRP